VTEEHLSTFRNLADVFGYPPGHMVIKPAPRSDTDPVLIGHVRSKLSDCSEAIVAQTVTDVLLSAQASLATDRQNKCRRFFEAPAYRNPRVGSRAPLSEELSASADRGTRSRASPAMKKLR
jgi:hypothetical protein